MFYRLCHVHETSPGTHTFFPTYTCPVYCWRSVQLLDFGLFSNLIHASQPIRTTFTGQWFASGFLQTPFHNDALAIGCTLPTAGRVRDFHPLERAPAGRTNKGTKHEVFLLGSLLSFVHYWFSSCGAFGLPETGKVCPSSSISCYHIKNQEIPAILLFFHQARKQAYIYPDMAAQHTLFHSSHKRTLFLLSHQNS